MFYFIFWLSKNSSVQKGSSMGFPNVQLGFLYLHWEQMQGFAGFIGSLHIGDRFGCFISLHLVLFFLIFLAADYCEGYLFILFHHYEFVGLD